jgi:hypothetical protein
MLRAGFKPEDVTPVEAAYQESRRTGVALPGEKRYRIVLDTTGKPLTWYREISELEFQKMQDEWDKKRDDYVAKHGMPASPALLHAQIGLPPSHRMAITTATERRITIQAVSAMYFVPAKAALPEVGIKDITPLEWTVGGAQVATMAMGIVPKGAVPFVSGAAASVFGYNTAHNWGKLTPAQKALAVTGTVLVAMPALQAITGGFGPAVVKVPTSDGKEVTIWADLDTNAERVEDYLNSLTL